MIVNNARRINILNNAESCVGVAEVNRVGLWRDISLNAAAANGGKQANMSGVKQLKESIFPT